MAVVTEHGLVNLEGKSVAERAMALIGIAQPELREALEREARERQLIPRRFVQGGDSAYRRTDGHRPPG